MLLLYITLAELKYQRIQCSLAFMTPEKHSALDSARAAVTSRCSLAGYLVSAEFAAAWSAVWCPSLRVNTYTMTNAKGFLKDFLI